MAAPLHGGPSIPKVTLDETSRHALASALAEACSGDTAAVSFDEEDLDEASKDWSFHPACRPCVVVSPASPEHVANVVRACVAARVSMVARGAGTGVEGGCIPYGGSVVISTSRLRRMEVLEDEALAVVGAGIRKAELNKFLAPKGLLFGPDPSSNPSLGGMASTGASGMTTLRYGTTKESVVSLLVVTPQGNLLRTRRKVRKSSSGYELTQLYMGSEGTLGIICELTVRLRQIPPLRSGGLIPFVDVKSAVDTVVAAVHADPPTLLRCELLNAEGVECTNAIFGTRLPACPTLFLEFVGKSAGMLHQDFDTVVAIAAKNNGMTDQVQFAASGDQLDTVWEARRGCYLATMKYRGMKGGDRVFVGDVCVPISNLASCVAASEADAQRLGLKNVICAHIADGNFHTLVPFQPGDEHLVRQFEALLTSRALDAGGTVTGEHGVGIGKIDHSCREHGEVHVAVQQALKRALDPLGLLNPGKVLPYTSVDNERCKCQSTGQGSKL